MTQQYTSLLLEHHGYIQDESIKTEIWNNYLIDYVNYYPFFLYTDKCLPIFGSREKLIIDPAYEEALATRTKTTLATCGISSSVSLSLEQRKAIVGLNKIDENVGWLIPCVHFYLLQYKSITKICSHY